MASAELPELVVRDAREWRSWLDAHHAQPDGVWVVLAKKGRTGPTTLSYEAALEEAVCFGWIDGMIRRRDDATYRVRFTPRRARSNWSPGNVSLVARLRDQGRMHPAGLAAFERGSDRRRPSGGSSPAP
jgi:uncharacterized protein YdeI (YjbR/CyaY-like superfamily)